MRAHDRQGERREEQAGHRRHDDEPASRAYGRRGASMSARHQGTLAAAGPNQAIESQLTAQNATGSGGRTAAAHGQTLGRPREP